MNNGKQIYACAVVTAASIVVCGLACPLAAAIVVCGLACPLAAAIVGGVAFPGSAGGSPVHFNGSVAGPVLMVKTVGRTY